MKVNRIYTFNSVAPNYKNTNEKQPAFGMVLRNDIPEKILKDKNYVCVFSGPSGVGKDTILNEFQRLYNYFAKAVTCTTRDPRKGEINGISYNFLSKSQFEQGIQNGDFLEYINGFSGAKYGTRKIDVDRALQGDKPVMLIIDVDGAKNVKEKLKNVVRVFIEPPSIEELEQRLIKRGSESIEKIKERVAKAESEMQCAKDYDLVIRNDNSSESVEDLRKIFMA